MRRFIVILLLAYGAAPAAELRSIEVVHDSGEYHLVSIAWFDAGIDETYRVFSRWDFSTLFSRAVVEARDLEAGADGRPGFYVKNRGCVLFFCMTLERQGYVELEPKSAVRAYADPEHSDFVFSNESWTFTEEDGGTSVLYELHMDPKFWVPPAIGPYMIKRKLKRDGGRAIDRIEAIAQRLARGEIIE